MTEIAELVRRASPAPLPQAIACDGARLWIGARDQRRLYALDPQRWSVREEIPVPGKPWGMTVAGDELRVILGQTDEDHRVIYRIGPARAAQRGPACPDDTGSHLSFDGARLFVSQWYRKRIVAVDESGRPESVIELPHEICGHTRVDGRFYCVTTDDETSGSYFLTRVEADGRSEDLAAIRFDARGLAFDGERFWTNHREAHQTVAFARPD